MLNRMDNPPDLVSGSPESPDLRKPRTHPLASKLIIPLLCGTVLALLFLAMMSYLWPVKITEGVSIKEAGRMALGTSNSIEQFYADYNRLPLPQAQKTLIGDADTDTSPTTGLIQVLMGVEPEQAEKQNPRNTDFLEEIKPAKASSKPDPAKYHGPWVNGLVLQDKAYSIVDAWGNYYRVRLDADGDKELDNPNLEQVAEGRARLPKRVIVWSPGKDGKEETWDDNPQSWD